MSGEQKPLTGKQLREAVKTVNKHFEKVADEVVDGVLNDILVTGVSCRELTHKALVGALCTVVKESREREEWHTRSFNFMCDLGRAARKR